MDIAKIFKDSVNVLVLEGMQDASNEDVSSTPKHIDEIYKRVLDLYSKPTGSLLDQKRYYHNINHIENCFFYLDEFYKRMNNFSLADKSELYISLMYHDCIYVAGSNDNERLSAWVALTSLSILPIKGRRLGNIYDQIRSTTHSLEKSLSFECDIICDIDLSSLGLPYDFFVKNSENIRKEFMHVDELSFINGRLNFINQILQRKSIYKTEYFKDRFEQMARSNLERHLADLENKKMSMLGETKSLK